MGSSKRDDAEPCLICGTTTEPTVEHIIPQTLLKRFTLDPNGPELARYRTWLCDPHNQATGKLHERMDTMDLIANGGPATREALEHLGHWAVWVTMLMGLAQPKGGVVPDEQARDLLKDRFGGGSKALPDGVRVYAAGLDQYTEEDGLPVKQYMVALDGDRRVILDWRGAPCGYRLSEGNIGAAATIGLGKFALLVLGKTHSSGPDHEARLDAAAASVGLELIQPLRRPLPELTPKVINMKAVNRLFAVMPFVDVEISLLPEGVRTLWTLTSNDQGATE
jgi:hypothetical protein